MGQRSAWFGDCYAFNQWVKVDTELIQPRGFAKVMDRRQCANPERHRSHDGSIQLCDMHVRNLQEGAVIDLIDGRSIQWADLGLAMNLSGGNCEDLWKYVKFVEVIDA